MTSDCREFFQKFPGGKYWRAFVICEATGIVEGYYSDGDKKIKLKSFSKIEPQRQISKFGHNSLKLDFVLPLRGIAVSIDVPLHVINDKAFS